jgi:hypothetical protein
MNNENQENQRPMILTAPACLTVPGFGFLVALNSDWCLPPKDGTQVHHRASDRGLSVADEGPRHQPQNRNERDFPQSNRRGVTS